MESKPIYFRPSEKDLEVLSLIAEQHPVFSDSPTELLRIALQAYWYEHALDTRWQKLAGIIKQRQRRDVNAYIEALELASILVDEPSPPVE